MPYQISTDYVPYKVLFVRIWGDYSGEDLKNSNTDVNACLDRSGLNTHVITDFRGLVSYPKNIALLAKTFSMFAHPNLGWEVIITPNATTRFVASTVMQIVKPAHGVTRFKAVSTPEEALEFLAHIAPLLPQLAPLPFEPVAW